MECSDRDSPEHALPQCRLELSVVVPAFNEAERIAAAIDDMVANLPVRVGTAWELIVVDDGSHDKTADVVSEITKRVPSLRLLQHPANQGKGAAVRSGILAAKGRFVMFADADGATPFSEADKLLQAMRDGVHLAVGTRVLGATVKRSMLRSAMGVAFRMSVHCLVKVGIQDTQCGFKMFRRQVARTLFQAGRETGYLFDVEILGLAARSGFRIREVPVHWREIAGSRIRLCRDSWRMLAGLFRVRRTLRSVSCRQGKADEPQNAGSSRQGYLSVSVDVRTSPLNSGA